jgi:aspartate ammonia-lyase
MPGKVNPVIPEVVNQVAFSVIGADATVTAAAEGGQLQLNAFEPVIAHSILQSIAWMTNASRTLRINCIDGITANITRLAAQVESSVGVVTALTPYIGYSASATLAHTALTTNASIAERVVDAGLMSAEEVARVLAPERLSGLTPTTGVISVIRPVSTDKD